MPFEEHKYFLDGIDTLLIQKFIRSPSCMAISRSHPRHLVQFREKKEKEKEKHFTSYFSLASFFKMTLSARVIRPGYLTGLSAPVIRPGYPPPVIHPGPGYLSSYLMLPNLSNHFIKLSDGDLPKCKTPLYISWWISASTEVNIWTQNILVIVLHSRSIFNTYNKNCRLIEYTIWHDK